MNEMLLQIAMRQMSTLSAMTNPNYANKDSAHAQFHAAAIAISDFMSCCAHELHENQGLNLGWTNPADDRDLDAETDAIIDGLSRDINAANTAGGLRVTTDESEEIAQGN